MAKKLHIMTAVIENEVLKLNVDENTNFLNVVPKGQMLVDSDQFAFIYILEMDEEYIYVVLHEEIWPILKEALDQSLSPYLFNQTEKLSLPMLYEELIYLIDNIKGNSNYGEEMVQKVESTF
jgi:hypothetical protein